MEDDQQIVTPPETPPQAAPPPQTPQQGDPAETYYNYLKKAGADVPSSVESFKKTLADENSARQYYSYLKSNHFDAPDTYESFAKTLGSQSATSPAQPAPHPQEGQPIPQGGPTPQQTKMAINAARGLNQPDQKPPAPVSKNPASKPFADLEADGNAYVDASKNLHLAQSGSAPQQTYGAPGMGGGIPANEDVGAQLRQQIPQLQQQTAALKDRLTQHEAAASGTMKDIVDGFAKDYKNYITSDGVVDQGKVREVALNKAREYGGDRYVAETIFNQASNAIKFQDVKPEVDGEFKKMTGKMPDEYLGGITGAQYGGLKALYTHDFEAEAKRSQDLISQKANSIFAEKYQPILEHTAQMFGGNSEQYQQALVNSQRAYGEDLRGIQMQENARLLRVRAELNRNLQAGAGKIAENNQGLMDQYTTLYNKAFQTVQQNRDDMRKMGAYTPGQDMTSLFMRSMWSGLNSWASTRGAGLVAAGFNNPFTDWLRNRGTAAEANAVPDGSYMDPRTWAAKAGGMVGSMLPDLAVTAITKNPTFAGLEFTASSTVSGMGDVYNQGISDGYTPAEASAKAQEFAHANFLATLPGNMLMGSAILANLKGVGGFIANTAKEAAGGLGASLPQQYLEQAKSKEGKTLGQFLREDAPQSALETVIALAAGAPVMRAVGHLTKAMGDAKVQGQREQFFSDIIDKQGLQHAQAAMESLYINGVLDKDGLAQGKQMLDKLVATKTGLQGLGVHPDLQKLYLANQAQIESLQASRPPVVEGSGLNEAMHKMYDARIKEVQGQMQDIVNGKTSYIKLTTPTGTDFVVHADQADAVLNDPTTQRDIADGHLRAQAFGDEKDITPLTERINEITAAKAPSPDLEQPAIEAPIKPQITEVRHGETEEDKTSHVSGPDGIPLNEEGKTQAEDLADQSMSRGFTKVAGSDVPRNIATSKAVADKLGIPHEIIPGLNSWDIGQWNGEPESDYVRAESYFVNHPDATQFEGKTINESFNQYKERILKARQELEDKNQGNTLLVNHSGNMKIWEAYQKSGGVWDEAAKAHYLTSLDAEVATLPPDKREEEAIADAENKDNHPAVESAFREEDAIGQASDPVEHNNIAKLFIEENEKLDKEQPAGPVRGGGEPESGSGKVNGEDGRASSAETDKEGVRANDEGESGKADHQSGTDESLPGGGSPGDKPERDLRNAGGRVEYEPHTNLSPEHTAIEEKFGKYLNENYNKAKADYIERFGRVLNTDNARELSPDYRNNKNELSSAVHEPASSFVKQVYADLLKALPNSGDVLFTAGGTGAGKTSAIERSPTLSRVSQDADVTYDANMDNVASSIKKIDQALASGREAKIIYVYRDPEEAFENGVVPRMKRIGRSVPVEAHVQTHQGSFESIKELQNYYKDNTDVQFFTLDNSNGRGASKMVPFEEIEKKANFDSELKNRIYESADSKLQSGDITQSEYNGLTLGREKSEPGRLQETELEGKGRIPGSGDVRQPEQSSSPQQEPLSRSEFEDEIAKPQYARAPGFSAAPNQPGNISPTTDFDETAMRKLIQRAPSDYTDHELSDLMQHIGGWDKADADRVIQEVRGEQAKGAKQLIKDAIAKGQQIAAGAAKLQTAEPSPFIKKLSRWFMDKIDDVADVKGILRKNSGAQEHELDQIWHASQKLLNEWNTVPKEDRLAFILGMERPDLRQGWTDKQKDMADQYRQRLDNIHSELTKALPNLNFLEDYFPHFWDKPDDVKNYFASTLGKTPMEGSKSFAKERMFGTILPGLEKGYSLSTDNPEELVRLAEANAWKFITAKNVFSDMQKLGYLKYSTDKSLPADWKSVDDKLFNRIGAYVDKSGEANLTMGSYMMPPDVAKLMNDYLSPGLKGPVKSMIQNWNNLKNSFQLGLGAFHYATTSLESIASGMVRGVQLMSTLNPKNMLAGAGHIAGAATFLPNIAMDLRRGWKTAADWKAGNITADVQASMDANARVAKQRMYSLEAKYNMQKAFGLLRADSDFGQIPKVIWNGLLYAPEMMNKFLMEKWVPGLKMGGYLRSLDAELQARKNMSPAEIQRAKEKTWDSMDDRLGQVVYDNRFFNKSVKDLGFLSVRSLGWTGGTISALANGIGEIPLSVKRAVKGQGITQNTAYLAALPMMAGLYGAFFHMMHTGQAPQSAQDYFFPKDGTKNADGTDHRIALPTYLKDVLAYSKSPATTLLHKTAPLVSDVTDVYNNKDFYGEQIYGPDDNVFQQGVDVLKHQAEGMTPFSLRQRPGDDKTFRQGTEQVFGMMPAPRERERSDIQNKIMAAVGANASDKAKTHEEMEQYIARRQLREHLFNGGSWEDAPDDLKSKANVSESAQDKFISDSKIDPYERSFKNLPRAKKIELYQQMSDEEKEQYKKYLPDDYNTNE